MIYSNLVLIIFFVNDIERQTIIYITKRTDFFYLFSPLWGQGLSYEPTTTKTISLKPLIMDALYVKGVCHLIKIVFVKLDVLLKRYSSSSKESISGKIIRKEWRYQRICF